ncbi:RHS repeat-associated core domain-containing protein [Fundidesulfovibrio soli]|uniref:RHS repeat-associated core domain-containing protein n=1 Tax=Fundidesulfovibrio soli TaxID=2922716 RepID=UPI001FAFD0A2|nr:RHS repeat-associated core domain-containing protein [Fundidesulfovibrio soli]
MNRSRPASPTGSAAQAVPASCTSHFLVQAKEPGLFRQTAAEAAVSRPAPRLARLRFIWSALLLLAWLAAHCPPALAFTITHQGTTLDIQATGLGTLSPITCPSPNPVVYCYQSDGLDPAFHTPLGLNGFFSLSVTPTATDSYCDAQHLHTLANILLVSRWTKSIGSQTTTLMAERSCFQAGNAISGSSAYQVINSFSYQDYTMANVNVYLNTGTQSSFFVMIMMDPAVLANMSISKERLGGPGDNPHTAFDRGGAGSCSTQGLPTYAVNTAMLNLAVEDTDLAWRSFGHDVALRRVWNMLPEASGLFGNGWSFAYESVIEAAPYASGGASLSLGSGQTLFYTVSGSQGQGSGQVAVSYAGASSVLQPILSAAISEATGTGTYTLYDKRAKLTSRYEYARDNAATGNHVYRLASITDRNGNALTLGYDGSGRLHTVTDASGRAVTLTLNAQGRCTRMDTWDNRAMTFQYSAAGNLTQSTDLAGNVSTYTYDAGNLMTSMSVAGKTTAFAYGSRGSQKYLSTVTDAAGKAWNYAFVQGGTQVTEPGGAVRSYASANGLTTSVTDALGHATNTVFNSQGLPVSITDPRGKTTAMAYDANGNLTQLTDPLGHTTIMAYDGDWNLTSKTDPLNNTWTFSYDAKGNLTGVLSPLGRATARTYNAKGLLTGKTLPDAASYAYAYDVHGNMTSVTDPHGKQSTLSYDAAGLNPATTTDQRGNTTGYQFDANRRVTQVALPGGGTAQFGYDCCAQSSRTSPTGFTTLMQRDALLRLTTLTDPLGKNTSYAYNSDGDQVSTTDPLGRVTHYGYDAAHQRVSITGPLGKAVSLSLDAAGNPVTVTSARGKATQLGYDDLGNLATVTDPLGAATSSIVRDAAGRVASLTNARNQQVSFLRDADGQVTAKKCDNAVVASYSYTPTGLIASTTDATGTTSHTVGPGGRIKGVAYPGGLNLALAYDDAGNVASMIYPGGLSVSYAATPRNRPQSVSFAGNSLSLGYDAAGHLTGETRSNGVQSVYGYDAAGRLTSVSHKKGAAVVAELAYARDAAGQVGAETGTWPLTPRLSPAKATAAYDNADGLLNWKADAAGHDLDGNLTSLAGSAGFSAAYDAENRLTSVTRAGVTTSYAYNGLGNRVRAQSGATIRNFHHDPWGRLLCETDGAGQVTANYIWAGDRLVASGTQAGGFVFHHADKTGNTLALTNAAGATVGAYAYSPYGAVAGHSGAAATPFTYAGMHGVMDDGGGLYHMANRAYHGVLGRFLQRDPLGFGGGDNLYRYVSDNPVTGVDPLGLRDLIGGPDAFPNACKMREGAPYIAVAAGVVLVGALLIPEMLAASELSAAIYATEAGTAAVVTTEAVVLKGATAAEVEMIQAGMALARNGDKLYTTLVELTQSPAGQRVLQQMQRYYTTRAATLDPATTSSATMNFINNMAQLSGRLLQTVH